MAEEYRSAVYTNRPDYADFAAPAKFQAIQSIIAKRLIEHPKAICSYSGGSDSDILIDVLERTRKMFNLPPIKYVFFNTGLEMEATKNHVKATAEKYGVDIETIRPKINIVQATRKYGIPFISKIFSEKFGIWQRQKVPMEIADEFNAAEDKVAKFNELKARYPYATGVITWLCGCDPKGDETGSAQFYIKSHRYLREYMMENPPDFKIDRVCCNVCKKSVAHIAEKNYDIVITGERAAEGGQRTIGKTAGCFGESRSKFRLRPLYYVSDADKAWYKDYYHIRYSDAYEVYGLTRTGCCGCPINYKAVEDLEKIKPYEPNVVKAAWNVFGKSYEYRRKYNEYKGKRMKQDRLKGQMEMDVE